MKRVAFGVILFVIFLLSADISHAAGIIMRVQQMKMQKQRQSQGVNVNEYGVQQPGAQPPGQQPPPQLTYQQVVDQRNQAIAQAIRNAHTTSESIDDTPMGNNVSATQGDQESFSPQASPSPPAVGEVVDLSDVWKKLDTKSTVWTLLSEDQAKVLTISEYIDRFRKEGVKINAPPSHYVQAIDQITGANPSMLQRPFGELLQIAAIVDYDFDNGMNKDELARKVLGEAGFEANKRRFSR